MSDVAISICVVGTAVLLALNSIRDEIKKLRFKK